LTNIISKDFNTPEEYIKETNVGPIITLNGDRTVTMIAGETYTDLGATADGGETVTVDTSNLDTNAVGTYTVSYSATETRNDVAYTRVENRFVNVVAPEEWVPGYITVPVILTDKLQPSLNGLALGQKYVFDFSQTRGKDFRLSNDGTTELTDGVIEAENTLVYTVPSDFNLPLYYYSPNTPNIGGYFRVNNVVYSDQGILKIGGITSIIRGQTYTFYFSSDFGTTIALSTSLNGTSLTSGISNTETSLIATLPSMYPYTTIFMKSLDTPNIGSSLTVSGTLDDGVIYFDNGILKATGITSIIRGQTYTFYFSSEYGTTIALSTSLNGTSLTSGISNTETSLTVTLPLYHLYNTIFLKSLDTLNIGSSLDVPGPLNDGVIYFDGDNLKATGITELGRGNTYTFYFSSDYGTTIALSTSLDGTSLTSGITTTDTSLTVVVPWDYLETIYLKSLDTFNIGSSLSVPFPSPEQTDNIPSIPISLDSQTIISLARGLYAYNETRQLGNYTFDNRFAANFGTPRATSYPELIIQALPGDTLTLTASVQTSFNIGVRRLCFSHWYGNSWYTFSTNFINSLGSQSFTTQLTIPSDIYGNFALGIYIDSYSGRNARTYSLHVIDPNYYL
jgi:hypothetical protein